MPVDGRGGRIALPRRKSFEEMPMPLETAWPQDWREGHFALRIQGEDGPMAIALAKGEVFDMTPTYGTVSAWLNDPHPAAAIRARGAKLALDVEALLADGRLLSPSTCRR
ncbi:hypothetical protein ACFQU7_21520 [Pseudoroseomonas wenyumeiae]